MGKIDSPSIFRRKVKVHSGEMVMTRKQMEAYQMSKALREVLDEIEDEGVEITEAELEQRINEFCKTYGITPPKHKKPKPHTCKQCGAPLHDGKCDYCGTEYN